jgi:hypothetical protein
MNLEDLLSCPRSPLSDIAPVIFSSHHTSLPWKELEYDLKLRTDLCREMHVTLYLGNVCFPIFFA